MIFDGHIYSIIGKRIDWADKKYGTNYSERTKRISREFKSEFQKFRNKYEDENYWQQKLFLSFLYKESEIVNEMKNDFMRNKSGYYDLNNAFNQHEKILHFSNDYGQIDFLLLMQQANRKIVSFVKDKEKRAIASTNYITKIRSLIYQHEFNFVEEEQTLLITTEIEAFYQEKINQFKKIVVLKNRTTNESLFNNFVKQNETNEYTVYTK